ncbi:MAG: alpha/beta fold hydrolase [Elusimicrobia bacterium]|nr:alpha/beta fold hydrolase [Elusimicrobiota bacterium]
MLWIKMTALIMLAIPIVYIASMIISSWLTQPPQDIPVHFVQTSDGWELPIYEFPGPKTKEVVYLQHGLGGHSVIFDLYPHGPSMARWLAAQGYHVFAGNLRGRPLSRAPQGTPPASWRYSDYLLRDAPAIARFIHKKTGKKFHWVGLSMGGVIGLPLAAREGREHFASLVTLGSALHYGVGGSGFSKLHEKREQLLKLKELPSKKIQAWLGPAVALGLVPNSFLYNRRNLTTGSVLMLAEHNFVNVTLAELEELGTTFLGPGIRAHDLNDALLLDIASKIPIPWLSVAGTMDEQSPCATINYTFERISAPRKEWFLAGRERGHQEDYGHMDLVCGKNAQTEVWPAIVKFIDENRVSIK